MNKILATFPGKHGDLLWALPTVRALSTTYGMPIDLLVSAAYGSLAPVIERQDYIGRVIVDPDWVVQDTAPMTPRTPPHADRWIDEYAQVFHLGYVGWPGPTLPEDVYHRVADVHRRIIGTDLAPLDLQRPWITAKTYGLPAQDLAIGFSDEHFELKRGIAECLTDRFLHMRNRARAQAEDRTDLPHPMALVNVAGPGSRWSRECYAFNQDGWVWEAVARWIAASRVFVGCCSALHVLAVAIGVPAVIVEPNVHRLQEVFWPLGFDGERVQIVRGGDGLPTVDARHTAEAIEAVWARLDREQTAVPHV